MDFEKEEKDLTILDIMDSILSKTPEELLVDLDDEETDEDYFERSSNTTDNLLTDISKKLDTIINLLRKR